MTGSLPCVLDDAINRYVFANGTLLYSVGPANELLVSHVDGQGTIIAQTTVTQAIQYVYNHGVFGGVIPGSSDPEDLPFRYAGEQYDRESGLIYLRARYQDPQSGRFLSRDAFGGYTSRPQSLNRYSYAGNNPVNSVDPSGMDPPLWTAFVTYDDKNPFENGTYPVYFPGTTVPIADAYFDPVYQAFVFEGRPSWVSSDAAAQAFGNNIIVGAGPVPYKSYLFYHEV